MRRYDDPIEVRTAGEGPLVPDIAAVGGAVVDGDAPVAFVWRERLYVVRSVLARWYERRVWWREAAASALLGLREDARTADGAGQPVGATPAAATTTTTAATTTAWTPERTVWRVEAAAGRFSDPGVYDLVHDPAAQPGGWRLVRLAD